MAIQKYQLFRMRNPANNGYKVWGYFEKSKTEFYLIWGKEPNMNKSVLSINQGMPFTNSNSRELSKKLSKKIKEGYQFVGEFDVFSKHSVPGGDISETTNSVPEINKAFVPKSSKFLSSEKQAQWLIKPSERFKGDAENFYLEIASVFEKVAKQFTNVVFLQEDSTVSIRRDGKDSSTDIMNISIDSSKVTDNFARPSFSGLYDISTNLVDDKELILISFYLFNLLKEMDCNGVYEFHIEYSPNLFFNDFYTLIEENYKSNSEFFSDDIIVDIGIKSGFYDINLTYDNMESEHEGELFF